MRVRAGRAGRAENLFFFYVLFFPLPRGYSVPFYICQNLKIFLIFDRKIGEKNGG